MEYCPDCNRSFQNNQALSAHRKYHKDEYKSAKEASNLTEQEVEIEPVPEPTPEPHTAHAVYPLDTYAPTIVKIKKLPHGINLPHFTQTPSGSVNLYAAVNHPVCIGAMGLASIPTGITMEIPKGFVAKNYAPLEITDKGLSVLTNLIQNTEINSILVNNTTTKIWIEYGMIVGELFIESLPEINWEIS